MNKHPAAIIKNAAHTSRTGKTAEPVNGPAVVEIAAVVVESGGMRFCARKVCSSSRHDTQRLMILYMH